MRQFIYAKRYVDTFHASSAAENQSYDLGLVDVNGVYNLALRDGKGLEKYYPICSKNLTIVTAKYNGEAEAYTATFTIPEVSPYSDYTVLFVKKGKQFNERANWTCTVHTTTKDNAETVAKKIKTYLINNKASLKLDVSLTGATITVTGTTFENYEIKLADELMGEPVTQTYAKEEFMGIDMIKDLAAKCAADAGFEYTAEDALELYPALDFDFGDTKEFDVVTLRFTEPRVMGTREEAVYQIIQIAVPIANGDLVVAGIKNKLGIE